MEKWTQEQEHFYAQVEQRRRQAALDRLINRELKAMRSEQEDAQLRNSADLQAQLQREKLQHWVNDLTPAGREKLIAWMETEIVNDGRYMN